LPFFRRKYSIAETGLLQGMIDIHSHLLSGVDDGIQTERETFTALEYLEEQGVRGIYLTPHVMETFPENSSKSLTQHFENLINGYAGNIDLRLAAEYMLDGGFESHLENRENKPLAIAEDHLLVETSYLNPPLNFHQTVQKIKKKGYRIILAHPERYLYMDKSDYKKLKADGFLFFQLNLLSPTGYYGRQVRENAEYLLRNDFYTFTGTDIHNLESHRQAFNIKSLTAKLTDRINVLIENNRQLFFN
jgi:tyrosine-protein phosphatase YwqE